MGTTDIVSSFLYSPKKKKNQSTESTGTSCLITQILALCVQYKLQH